MDKEGYNRFFMRNPMPESMAADFFKHMQLKHFDKGMHVIQKGETNCNFYIIDTGIWSGVEEREDDQDLSLWFAFAGEPVFNIWSYIMEKPSPIDIISETDSKALVITKPELETLMRENRDIMDCILKITLGQLAHYENRLLQMAQPSNASERYLWLAKWHPELLQQVPLSRIASFLGITVQSLSRIRRNIFLKK